MTTKITGIVRDLEGQPLANSMMRFERRSGVRAQAGATVVPRVVNAKTDSGGNISVELYPGEYRAQAERGSGALTFSVGVPEDVGEVDLTNLIDQLPEITPTVALVTRQARDEAVEAAESTAGSVAAAESAQGASESARDASQAARDRAQEWAENPEDEPVEQFNGNELFSGRHYAAKAAQSAAISPRVIYVDTIADLQALDTSPLPDGQPVSVAEYHEGTGRGGRTMIWDGTSTEVPNGGTVLAPDSGDGRWLWDGRGDLAPEHFGAVGDGTTDDSAILLQWLEHPTDAIKKAARGVTYAWGTERVADTSFLRGDMNGATILLTHTTEDDNDFAYALDIRVDNDIANFEIKGQGSATESSGIVVSSDVGSTRWHNPKFTEVRRRAAFIQSKRTVITGVMEVDDCQTYLVPSPQGAVRFECEEYVSVDTIRINTTTDSNYRGIAFVNSNNVHVRQLISDRYAIIGAGASGQVLYFNFVYGGSVGKIFIGDYECDESSNAVYCSRDCSDIDMPNCHIKASGHVRARALVLGGCKRVRANGYFYAEGSIITIEGHRAGFTLEDCEVTGVFECFYEDTENDIDEAPISLRSNLLGSGSETSRGLYSALVKGRFIFGGAGAISNTASTDPQDAKSAFCQVSSTYGVVNIEPECDFSDRDDHSVVGIGGSEGARPTNMVVVRNARIKVGERAPFVPMDGTVLIDGGYVDCPDNRNLISNIRGEPNVRLVGLTAIKGRLIITLNGVHLIDSCRAKDFGVPASGLLGTNTDTTSIA